MESRTPRPGKVWSGHSFPLARSKEKAHKIARLSLCIIR